MIDIELMKEMGRKKQMTDTEFVEEQIERALEKRDFAPLMWLVAVVSQRCERCRNKAFDCGFDLLEGITPDVFLQLGAKLLVEESMAELAHRFSVTDVDGIDQIRRLDPDSTCFRPRVELRRQEVIEAFYVFNKSKCIEMWLVIYDDFGFLDNSSLLTAVNFKMKTIIVNNRLRGRRKKREEEVRFAFEDVLERHERDLEMNADGGDHE